MNEARGERDRKGGYEKGIGKDRKTRRMYKGPISIYFWKYFHGLMGWG